MSSSRCVCFVALVALLILGVAVPAAAQTTTTTTASPIATATAVNIPAGDDGWTTTRDNKTFLRYDLNPIPAGFFGPGSLPFSQKLFLHGVPLANNGGLSWNTDTIVRRQAQTGLMAVGGCRTVPIDFQALHVQSNTFTVNYQDGTTETWQISGGLTQSAAQPIGSMTLCRTCGDGGTFDADLPALFLLRYNRISPLPNIQLQQDCGLGQCPQVNFRTRGAKWALVNGPSGFQPGSLGIDPLPGGVQVDVDADGIVDPTTTIGRSNFQGAIDLCIGGGGAPECAEVEHVANDTGPKDHSKSSHANYAASGDSDGNGTPDHCECNDENGDGIDDDSGEPCPTDEEPIETDADATL